MTVFGNSAGGPSAMWFAMDHPERTEGLILHSSAAPNPPAATPPRWQVGCNFLYWPAELPACDRALVATN